MRRSFRVWNKATDDVADALMESLGTTEQSVYHGQFRRAEAVRTRSVRSAVCVG